MAPKYIPPSEEDKHTWEKLLEDGAEGIQRFFGKNKTGCLVLFALVGIGITSVILFVPSFATNWWDSPIPPATTNKELAVAAAASITPSTTPIITAPTSTFTPTPTLTPTSTSTATPTPLPAPKVANLIVGQRGIAGGVALTVTSVRITDSTVIVNYLIENLTANALPLALQNFGLTFAANLYRTHGLDEGTIFKTNSLGGNSQIDGRVVFSYGGVTSGFVFAYVEGRTNDGQFFVNLGR